MRILHIISGLGCGGAENLLLDVTMELHARGIAQRVLYLSDKADLVPRFAQAGVDTHLIDHAKLGTPGAIRAVRREIARFSPSVVHTHLLRADIIGRVAALTTPGMVVFTTLHNMDEWRRQRGPAQLAMNAFERATINRARRSGMIAVAECCRAYAMRHSRLHAEKIVTLPNFASERAERRTGTLTREQLGISAGDLVLVTVGRLQPQKAHIDLLEAAATLKRRGVAGVRILLLGEGELRPTLETYIREHALEDTVKLVGFVENVYDYLDISDAFVLTSTYEGNSVALLEALQNGLPALCTDIASTREMIKQGTIAYSFAPHDTERLADLIAQMRERPDMLRRLDADCEQLARGPARYVDALLDIYAAKGVR